MGQRTRRDSFCQILCALVSCERRVAWVTDGEDLVLRHPELMEALEGLRLAVMDTVCQ